ncbi:MAG: isochorismatase family protein, partial [Bdellovibrionales bacterium]|nr:isochorismatase family protein [Bdellovibrionales bacterium]
DKIIDSQIAAIERAKELGLPIVIVEYEDYGDTNSALKKAIGDYGRVRYFQKDRDGMFDPRNSFRGPLMEHLKELDVGTLLITGANGGACVKRSIRGALENEFQVIAYTQGIADFNYKEFIYPYKYSKDQVAVDCERCSFREASSVDQLMSVVLGEGRLGSPMIKGTQFRPEGSQ